MTLTRTRWPAAALAAAFAFAAGHAPTRAQDGPPELASTHPLDYSTTAAGFLGDAGAAPPALTDARLAVDGFLPKRFSAGIAVSYFRRSTVPSLRPPQGLSFPLVNDRLTLALRIGYLAPLGRAFAIWPRAGYTFVRAREDDSETQSTFSFHALALEAPVAFRLHAHLLLTLGPTLDVALRGRLTTNSRFGNTPGPARHVEETDLGVALGLAGYF